MKPELASAPSPFGSAYSPSAERDRERRAAERRAATATPPRRHHSRSPIRGKPGEPPPPGGRPDSRERQDRPLPTGAELKAPGRHLNGHASRADPLSQLYGAAAAAAAAPRPLLPYGLDPSAGPRLDPYAALSAGADPLRSLERDRQLMQLNGLAPLLYREPPPGELALAQSRHQQLERLALERDRQLLDHKLQLAGMYGAPVGGYPRPPAPPPPMSAPPPGGLQLVGGFGKPGYGAAAFGGAASAARSLAPLRRPDLPGGPSAPPPHGTLYPGRDRDPVR